MPRESVRWNSRKKISVGTMLMSEAAAVVVTSMRRSPVSELIAIGTVCEELSTRNASGIMYSFHVQMKKNASSTLYVGFEIGNTTSLKMRQRLAPSIVAASRIDLGNVPNTDDSR